MNYFFICVAIAAAIQQLPSTVADGCQISLKALPSPEPLLLTASIGGHSTSYQLLKPTGENTILPVGTKLRLFCPGTSNIIKLLEQNALDLICRSGNIWKTSSGVQYTLKNLGCKSTPTSDLKLTSEKCGANGRGYIFEAGFSIDTQNFATVFTICYDKITERTLYTHNTINGAAIKYAIPEGTRRAFRANGMKFTTTATNNFYTINNQVARFENYFGKQQKYVDARMFLARGHLTPNTDFVFGYEQLATYFYSNVAPEFQSINAGSWLRVEYLARRLGEEFGEDLKIYNGYMGLLELPHPKTNNLVAIFLDEKQQIKVPKYYFKVIKHEPSDAAIVMITLNNPYASKSEGKEFCKNLCLEAGLHSEFFNDGSRGYTFCCELDKFKQHYEDLPDELTASCLLTKNAKGSICEKKMKSEAAPKDNAGCLITIPSDIPSPEPVYILSTISNPTPRLLRPTGPNTILPTGSSLNLLCAGTGNILSALNEQSLMLTCQQDNTFYSSKVKRTFKLSELRCSRIPTPDMQLTSERCASDKGYIFQPGYFVGKNFVDAFSVCYDKITERSLYARNIINGATQSFKVNKISRRPFRADGLQSTMTATNIFYTINNQLERFENYFGSQQQYIDKSMFLARGHLAPDADFIFGYEQVATYYYANVAPQFQIVNSANWIRVENIARSLAIQYQTDLLTFTSTLGLLQLPSLNGKKVIDIYLDDSQKVPVPKWFYKILLHPQLNTDIVMITLNNPFAKPTDIVEFCKNVCDKHGINSPHFKDVTRGYTFCCTYEDFQNAVQDLPAFDLPGDWKFKTS